MSKIFSSASKAILLFLTTVSLSFNTLGNPPSSKSLFQIKIYLLKTKEQEDRVDKYLQSAFIPALHRMGVTQVGVFKPIGNDTAEVRRIYVLIPFKSLDQWLQAPEALSKDATFNSDAANYLESPYNNPPFVRVESILLKAFSGMPGIEKPMLNGPVGDRIYELRSYEGPTERKYENKVKMFNDGDEIGLFKRLNFNAVFYSEVISGAHMPNLMYMTSFDNMASHDQHWKAFVDDPYWKKLSAMPEYQNNVSHIDIVLLHPTAYSEL